jgi:hypothetical protein
MVREGDFLFYVCVRKFRCTCHRRWEFEVVNQIPLSLSDIQQTRDVVKILWAGYIWLLSGLEYIAPT